MRTKTILLNIAGVLLFVAGAFLFTICYMTSDPEIEGESARTPLSAYLISLIPMFLGILLFIVSHKIRNNRTLNKL